jgi:glycosyltransferase involved in cell wall biosynthesis
MILSIVTGTYQRLASLVRMIDSVRAQIPRGLLYEFVVVDGGSTDGTLMWCQQQPDIHLIEHGTLKGAIRAFCDGARAARGEYVVLANDDIVFKPNSILAALVHLEQTPTCGAVAFADNRTSLVRGNGQDYRVEGMGATTANGEKTMVHYAQVGMFRRELGNAAGWWGDTDPIMEKAHTYGGDSYLSARLWEDGYSVDAVPEAVIEDYVARDKLRDINNYFGPKDSKAFYTRFPTVNLPAHLNRFEKDDRLRILHLPIYETGHPQAQNREAGLTEALADYGLVIETDFLNEPNFDLVMICKRWQPDLMIMQCQGIGPRITSEGLIAARAAVPGMIVVNWNGDIHPDGLISPGMIEILRLVDLQTTVNAQVLEDYQRLGICAAYWQIYFKEAIQPLPIVPSYEILWQGNCYNAQRDALINTLRGIRLPDTRKPKLGLYGNCRGSNGNTHYRFDEQAALYKSATITIGDTFPGGKAYVSNRLFQCLGNGGFLLQQRSDGLQEYTGLTPGIHYIQWDDLPDLEKKIAEWLNPARGAERTAIAHAGMEFVRANFSAGAQVRKLFFDLLPLISKAEILA